LTRYQGKIESLRTGDRGGHDPNRLFDFDQDGSGLDLANLKNGEMGRGWTKLWFIWQKLDERYGPTWYPRWMWVKNVRWDNDPNHRLTWDEVVEDMSIACGEDLFPFFRKLGTTLGKERFSEAVFRGKRIVLPPATLAVERAGPARTEAIGDFRKSEHLVPGGILVVGKHETLPAGTPGLEPTSSGLEFIRAA